MPSKASTKSKGKDKPQPQPSLTASCINMGPPFAGQGAYPYPLSTGWAQFPYPDGRVVPCPGFWGYGKHYGTTGGIVAQLGAEPGTGAAGCTLYAGYQYNFQATVAGDHIFVLTMNLGPVTRRPRYGRVQVAGILQIMGPGGHWADFYDDLPSNTGLTLAITPRLQAGGFYTLKFGVAPIVENAGYQSYGEAILNSSDLKQYLPYGAQAGQLAPARSAKSSDLLTSLLKSGNEQEAQPISLEEASGLGVGYTS
ncbi:MAG: hypothetical protein QOD32_511 [Pyrinomonadaceae bacterium]|jgi:hypothetical protein|nr:hypothetical protein [Pyrinomonadaceae bacterium]